jgi:hypothetical protein
MLLERLDAGHPISLSAYYVLAGLWIGLTLIPWCACMGVALKESLPYVRVFRTIERKSHGCHSLPSNSRLASYSTESLASHLSPAAVADFLEWDPGFNAQQQFTGILQKEFSHDDLIRRAPGAAALQDNRPVNEYFMLRRLEDRQYLKNLWGYLLYRMNRKAS